MKTTLPIILATFTWASAASAQVQVFTENFDAYNTGNLVGQGTPPWTQLLTVTTNPLQVNASKAVPLATSGQDAQRGFDSAVTNTPGNSLKLAFDVVISAAASGDFFAMLTSTTSGSAYYNRIYAQTSATAGFFKLGLSAGTPTAGTTPFYGGDLTLNESHHVETTWNFISGAANDTFSMTVDATPYVSEFTWNTATAEPNELGNFGLRQGGGVSTAPAIPGIDNIVVTSVPEPSAAFLVGVAGALLAQIRRHSPR